MGPEGYGTPREISELIRSYLASTFIDPSKIESLSNSDSLQEMGIIDSSGILEILIFAEGTFNVRIEDDEVIPENLGSVDHLTSFILRKLSRTGESISSTTASRFPDDEPQE